MLVPKKGYKINIQDHKYYVKDRVGSPKPLLYILKTEFEEARELLVADKLSVAKIKKMLHLWGDIEKDLCPEGFEWLPATEYIVNFEDNLRVRAYKLFSQAIQKLEFILKGV